MNKLGRKIYIKTKRNIERVYRVFVITIITFLLTFNTAPAFAGGFGSSIFATGTKSLITDIGTWLLILAPIAGSVVGVYFFIRRSAADEMDQSATRS